eukprot:08833.XXX_246396_240328_1 [CDS] Oithona nana genome sequencing.
MNPLSTNSLWRQKSPQLVEDIFRVVCELNTISAIVISCHKTRKLDKVNLNSELRKLKCGN